MIKLYYEKILAWIKAYHLEIGVGLCFILPPIGIVWLVVIGWDHLNKAVYRRAPFSLNVTTFFFMCLLVSAAGAGIVRQNASYLLIVGLIAGYLGLYLYIKETLTLGSFQRYKRIVIAGGFYLFLSGLMLKDHSLNGIFAFLTGTQFIGGSGGSSQARLFGSAYNPNFTAFLLLLTFTFVLTSMIGHFKNKENRLLLYQVPLILVIAAAIFQTGSRSGVATMFILCLFLVIKLNPKLGITCLGMMFAVRDQLIALIPRTEVIDHSAMARKEIWLNSLSIWKDNTFFGTTPLGYYDSYLELTGKGVPHAHNMFLAFFAEYGTIGGLAFLILAGSVAFKFCCLYFMESKRKHLLNLFMISIPIIFLTGILDHPLVSPQTALITVILLASWDRYTEPVHVVQKSAAYVKRAFLRISLQAEKSHNLTKSQKNKGKY
ncbi:O-antigen ligase domain-containing protein [Bacillus mangrovi]|uniref:O-antigen ligase domain-containing protein n=1 Tax=Metabacillus mangrovi TaxID=1491830 RepID=A0A7X2S552_9BACI|nr:O-antigen ligase family protein [Metabacillus mangrovi]MTH53587.1 O-antigen ligase domain-containing protein [Metabacillus mangrovi]